MTDQESGGHPESLHIKVTASGRILLEGRDVDLAELESALDTAKINGSVVHYDRENPSAEAPREAEAAIKLITARKLRIALPSFVTPPANVIEMPGPDQVFAQFFAKVRRQAAKERGISLVRPELVHFRMPAPPAGTLAPQMAEGVKAVIPSDQPRNIAAVAPVGALVGNPPALPELGREIPFFGLLIGLAYVGHAVWVFEAAKEMFTAGCDEADVLIVDSDAIAGLPPGWLEDAGAAMRNGNVLIYDRSRQKIGAARTAGEIPGRIEFPNP